jgi:hypothetical protein
MQRRIFFIAVMLLIASYAGQAQNTKYDAAAFIKLRALKTSLDLVKTKYKNDADYYERKMLAKMDMEAIILLAPANPFSIGGNKNEVEGEYVAAEPAKGWWTIRTGLRFNGRGEKEENEGDSYAMSIYYLTLPIYLQYMLPVNDEGLFFAGIGPYFGYALWGKYKDKIAGETTTEKIRFGKDNDGVRRGDFGLGLVAGYEFKRIMLQLSYDYGLSNINFDKDFKVSNRAVGISVGYVINP